ncbi:FecR domain-containing protein [Comamonas sp. JUb58]|uniref:FecR family protein n=1 Tax=Comamonas sp. JUb58 TaxID=2485114 RepID=UPI00105BD793|nr:FecR domain-containing protein [Comamonas sp. JUb58]TDS78787.1 FecR family protein [Comamonas sp. JUb58]
MTPLNPELAQRHQRAADYFVRRREHDWTGADERELNAWLSDPVNRSIFEDLSRVALDLRHIPRPRLASDPPLHSKASASETAGRDTAESAVGGSGAATWQPRRRALAPALLAAVLMAGGGWYGWRNHASYELTVATGPGETREVDLPDGSQVALNFSSSLRVRYYPGRRETELGAGEAFFRVAHDANRPFTVDSGNSRVRVVGTAFNVRAGPPQLTVKVLEGKVEVRPDRHRDDLRALLLTAGGGVSIEPATGQYTALAAPAGTVGDWRNGQLVFEQAALAEVAAELSRYLGEPVAVEGAALGKLAVSGMVITSAPAAFLRSLPDLLPVRVDRAAQGGWRIRPRG